MEPTPVRVRLEVGRDCLQNEYDCKGTFQKRFSGFCPLRGYREGQKCAI